MLKNGNTVHDWRQPIESKKLKINPNKHDAVKHARMTARRAQSEEIVTSLTKEAVQKCQKRMELLFVI